MRQLAESHPRWARATVRGRAAPAMMAQARAEGVGLSQMARMYSEMVTPRVAGRSAAVRSYEAACACTGDSPWPLEVSQLVEQLRGWAVGFCADGGAPTSVATYMGRLVAHARERGVVWGGAERGLHAFTAELAEDFPHETRRAAGVTEMQLATLVRYLDKMQGLYARMWTALLTTMWAAMLRVGEACDTALRWDRVIPTADGGINLLLPWRKNEKGVFSRIGATFTIPRAAPQLDATRALRAYAAALGLEVGVSTQPVFVRRRRSGALAGGTLASWFNEDFRELWERAGLPDPPDSQTLSSHGLRRGGRTAVGKAGVDLDVGGAVGGWKSHRGQMPYIEAGAAHAASVGSALQQASGARRVQQGRSLATVSGSWAQRTAGK